MVEGNDGEYPIRTIIRYGNIAGLFQMSSETALDIRADRAVACDFDHDGPASAGSSVSGPTFSTLVEFDYCGCFLCELIPVSLHYHFFPRRFDSSFHSFGCILQDSSLGSSCSNPVFGGEAYRFDDQISRFDRVSNCGHTGYSSENLFQLRLIAAGAGMNDKLQTIHISALVRDAW